MKTKAILMLVLSFFVISTLTTDTFAQVGKKPKLSEAKGLKGSGDDKNVKAPKGLNDPNASLVPPSEKGGPKKARTSTTKIIVDNWTKWYIDVYNDGTYQGTVGPYDKVYFYDYGDVIELYGRADFTDGTYLYWGPQKVYNDYNYEYTWKLTN